MMDVNNTRIADQNDALNHILELSLRLCGKQIAVPRAIFIFQSAA